MDISELKKISQKNFDIALAKQNEIEKARSRMIMAYEGHLFLANSETINYVSCMKGLKDSFVILDTNENPVLIDDPAQFLDRLITKNQEVLNSYLQAYKNFEKRA
jgi:hypothetical protein